ncbi:TerB family tellurite resistance protein [Abyssalbus ytuae]|uniref:TerB family tellurite resistance protein n=1 Tax=Abyssalbus ytuae TaxID=2926907 RepID=A0A9E6ZI53_9FLAO|nr:TerB family tellurite resistance protein [Abyssalbus ytuae]UOB15932.1 TerB family tellurite resistance protein [Abyssalbus ytuae]
MVSRERFYRAFGELLYVVATKDGLIQKQEVKILEEIINQHPMGKEIKWSFDYEREKNSSVDEVYKKVLEVYKDNGPDYEYDFIIYALEKIAEASDGINREENEVITNFSRELLEKFKKDLS